MTDLEKRLRYEDTMGWDKFGFPAGLLGEAADEIKRWKHHHDVQVSRKRNLKRKLEAAIEAIKFAHSKGFEWPTDPFAAIDQASTDWPPKHLKPSASQDTGPSTEGEKC